MRCGVSTLLLLVAAAPALAWGPRTHAVVHARALPRLVQRQDLAWLEEPGLAEVFLRAGASGDMTFDLLSGGKADRRLDAHLHGAGFLEHLVERARARGSRRELAFALGLVAHLAADRVGNRRDAVTHDNLFGWPHDRGWGDQRAGDAAPSVHDEMLGLTTMLAKVVVDAALEGEQVPPARREPWVEVDLLADALGSYRGGRAARGRARLEELAVRHAASVRVLGRTTRALGGTAARRVAMAEALGAGRSGEIPGIPESVEAVVEWVPRALEGDLGSLGRADLACGREGGKTYGHAALCGALRDVARRPRPGPEALSGGVVAGLDRGAARRRALVAFLAAVESAGPATRWEEVRARVRGALSALEPVGWGRLTRARGAFGEP